MRLLPHPILRQSFDVFYLMLIGFDDKELKNNMGGFRFKLSFPPYDIFCSFYYFLQFSADAIRLVGLLRCAINGDNQSVQSGLNRPPRGDIRKIVGVGRRSRNRSV